jgi:hypothetical protein
MISRRMPSRVATALSVLLLVALLPAAAHEEEQAQEGAGPNLLVTIIFTQVEDDTPQQEKSYQLVVRAGGRPASVRSGFRVPIPTTNFNMDQEGSSVPVTSYSYQNVGFDANVEADLLRDGRIKLQLRLESSMLISANDEGGSIVPPTVAALNQNLNLILKAGEPLQVASVDGHKRGTVLTEIRVDILT